MRNLSLPILLMLVLLIALVPFMFIWCLNILFPVLEIGYNLETWVAALGLLSFTTTRARSQK